MKASGSILFRNVKIEPNRRIEGLTPLLISGETGLKQPQDTTALVDWHFQEFFDLLSPDHDRHF